MNAVNACALCREPDKQLQRVPGYRFLVCDLCWQNAAGGWARSAEPILFAALAQAGLLIPDRNDSGLLPRAYMPPEDYAL
ncbi:MAG: hypothetical protein CMQ44_08720 [Gammaproteobacteria bacterium]|nr:hypothetical protein [Gammaproteobacteria bacterium]